MTRNGETPATTKQMEPTSGYTQVYSLDLEVDLIKLDMYQKYEHKKPWFVKVNDPFFVSKSKNLIFN